MHSFIYLSIGFWLHTVLVCRGSMSLNCPVFHTFVGISSSTAAFLLLIFLSTESSSSCVNGPSLIPNWLVIIFVIGSCVTFGGFASKFLKCCFNRYIRSSWQFCFRSTLPSDHFVYFLACYPRFFYLQPIILSYRSDFVCILFVILGIC